MFKFLFDGNILMLRQPLQTAKILAQKTRVDLTVLLENKGLEGVRVLK